MERKKKKMSGSRAHRYEPVLQIPGPAANIKAILRCMEGTMGDVRLTAAEKQTIIDFDQTAAAAVIFTYDKGWQRHMEKTLGLKPTLDNGCGARQYEVDKKRIRPPRAPRKISAETKKKLANGLKKGRQKKQRILQERLLQ